MYTPSNNEELLDPNLAGPSDVNQGRMRALFIALACTYTLWRFPPDSLSGALNFPLIQVLGLYAFASVILQAWSFRIAQHAATERPISRFEIFTKRVCGAICDLGAVSAYMAVGAEDAVVVYVIYISVIIGNSIRYGTTFLYISLAIALVGFSVAVTFNPVYSNFPELIIGSYFGILLLPLYSKSLISTLQQLLRRLREIDSARTTFIANISHELRTPLHGIIANTDLVLEDGKLSEKTRKGLLTVSESAEHLLQIVNNILEVSKYQGGTPLPVELSSFALWSTLRRSLAVCEASANKKSIRLHLSHDFSLPPIIHSDAKRLAEIIINLVGNSVKYTDEGLITVSTDRVDENNFQLTVSDTGIGIPESKLQEIFEPFVQVDESLTRQHASSGLGLTLVKQMVNALHGEISLTSEIGKGTKCVVTLPILLPSAPAETVTRPSAPASCWVLTSPEVLAQVEQSVRDAGLRVLAPTVNSIHGFIGQDQAPAFCLVDVRMEDAMVTVFELLRHCPEVAIIAVGGVVSESERRYFNGVLESFSEASLQNLQQFTEAENPYGAVPHANYIGPKLKVLVADDTDVNLQTAKASLEFDGHAVVTACNGTDALDILETSESELGGRFDLLFVDLHMPDMNGVEMLRLYHFLAEDPAPAVLVTADATDVARELAAAAGFVAYLTKPYRPSALRKLAVEHARVPADPVAIGAPNEQPITLEPVRSARVVSIGDAIVEDIEIRELKACGLDDMALSLMIGEYISDARAYIEKARLAFKRDEYSELRDLMHALKGSSRQVGAIALARRAEHLEKSKIFEIEQTALETLEKMLELLDRSRDELMEILRSAA